MSRLRPRPPTPLTLLSGQSPSDPARRLTASGGETGRSGARTPPGTRTSTTAPNARTVSHHVPFSSNCRGQARPRIAASIGRESTGASRAFRQLHLSSQLSAVEGSRARRRRSTRSDTGGWPSGEAVQLGSPGAASSTGQRRGQPAEVFILFGEPWRLPNLDEYCAEMTDDKARAIAVAPDERGSTKDRHALNGLIEAAVNPTEAHVCCGRTSRTARSRTR